MMLDEHMTPRKFWADAISTACYISIRIFLHLILHLTPFELHFGRKPSISHLRPFGCKCFLSKYGNLDKFESHSSDGLVFGYTPHGRSYRVFNLDTNTVVESCNVTFDETTPCPRGVFECAGDKEIEDSIIVDEELQGFNSDEYESLLPSLQETAELPSAKVSRNPRKKTFFVGFILSSVGPWPMEVSRQKLHNFRRPPTKIT
jgi:hypothetical protein